MSKTKGYINKNRWDFAVVYILAGFRCYEYCYSFFFFSFSVYQFRALLIQYLRRLESALRNCLFELSKGDKCHWWKASGDNTELERMPDARRDSPMETRMARNILNYFRFFAGIYYWRSSWDFDWLSIYRNSYEIFLWCCLWNFRTSREWCISSLARFLGSQQISGGFEGWGKPIHP